MIGIFKGHSGKFNGIEKFGTLYQQNEHRKKRRYMPYDNVEY